MHSVLSYFKEYFNPRDGSPKWNHSAGWIARNLHQVLSSYGDVSYLDSDDRPSKLKADLMIGHFWSFEQQCSGQDIDHKLVFYAAGNIDWTRQLLTGLASKYDVPFPDWDFPPGGFNNTRTLELADKILLIGNRCLVENFPKPVQHKIRLVNYSVRDGLFTHDQKDDQRSREFCYVATHCDLRKGFMDVLKVWSDIFASEAVLHAVGAIRSPWDELLENHNNGSIHYHGWVESSSPHYDQILQRCKFAYIPTYSDAQMGTLLEVIYHGCLPITTRESGLCDEVLAHCIVINPRDIQQQRDVIREVLSWSHQQWLERVNKVRVAASEYQSLQRFQADIHSVIGESLDAGDGRFGRESCVTSL